MDFDDARGGDGGGCAIAPGREGPVGFMVIGLALMIAGATRPGRRRRR